PVGDVRVFAGRSSVGVRGIRLHGDDLVISMSILRHEEIELRERDAYLRRAAERRRQNGEGKEATGEGGVGPPPPEVDAQDGADETLNGFVLSEERFAALVGR